MAMGMKRKLKMSMEMIKMIKTKVQAMRKLKIRQLKTITKTPTEVEDEAEEEAVEEVEAGAEAGELLEVALPSFTEAEAAIVAEAATTTITIT